MKSFHRRFLLLFALSCFFGTCASMLAENPKPNFVFILMDDMGWTDVACFGSKFYQSPNIDKLAAEGMKFTQAYAACPVCSPTRASIMTGKYPARLHLTDFIPGRRIMADQKLLRPEFLLQLPLEETTLPEALKSAGYISGGFGKWHLGGKGFEPDKQGFDVYDLGNQKGSYPGSDEAGKGEYGLTESALKFVEQNKDRPFFLYLPYYSVHIPLHARSELVQKYEKLRDPKATHTNSLYAAMIESVDTQIGRLLAKLEELKLAENTVVIFVSDNGGLSVHEGENTPATSNAPLREGKGYLHEGGIRVPLIVRWPGVVKPGTVCTNVVSSVDYFPSLLEIAGVKIPTNQIVDGRSIVPLLKQNGAPKPRQIFWHYPHYSNQGGSPGGAMRDGAFKLIEWFETGQLELYDLQNDPAEKTNLIDKMPDKAVQMQARLDLWRRDVGAQMMLPNPAYDPKAKQ
jgi:arylsulfatase A